MKTVTLAVIAILIAASARAQVSTNVISVPISDTLPLTLDDAVRRAVENNPDLAVVRLGTEVEAARVGESRGARAGAATRGLAGLQGIARNSIPARQ